MQRKPIHDASAATDFSRVVDLFMKLAAVPGTSGEEGRVAKRVIDELHRAGAPAGAIRTDSAHRRSPIGGQIGNLVFKMPGAFRAPRRMLIAHLDTVPICTGSRPVRKGGLIRSADPKTGLGADNRAGAAVVLHTACEILRRKLPHPPLTFLWPVQEEIGLQGARLAAVGLWGKPNMAFNFDGGSPAKLTIGATGGYRMSIEIEGVASHAGVAPELGVSAVAIASLAIADLQRNGWHGQIRKSSGEGTSNVGSIHGGEATNVVADRVTVRAEARSHVPKFRARIVREIKGAFRRAVRQVVSAKGRRGKVRIDGHADYESYLLPADTPCVLAGQRAVRSIGLTPSLAVAQGGLDANWTIRHGVPTVSLGCGQLHQHMVGESLDVGRFEQACRVAMALATQRE